MSAREGSESLRDDALFFALVPDAPAAWRMAAIGRELRLTHGLDGKLLPPEHLHMRLIGLGGHEGLPSGLVDLAVQAAGAISMPSFDIMLDRARSLAGLRRPLVLCGDEGLGGAILMQLAIQIAMNELGAGGVGRRLLPCVMLLDGWRGLTGEEHAIAPVRWTAAEFVLMHSRRGRNTPDVVGRWTLVARNPPTGLEEPARAIGW